MSLSAIVVILVILAIVVIGLFIALAVEQAHGRSGMEEKLSELVDFTATQKLIGSDGMAGVAIDEARSKICLVTPSTAEIVPYRDILAVEVFEGGNSVTRTSRTSQVGGALLGGIALGGVGAIVGGLSGARVSRDQVVRVDLRITVNKTDKPFHVVTLLNLENPMFPQDTKGTERHGLIYQNIMRVALHWNALLNVVISKADEEDRKTLVEQNKADQIANRQLSVADEIAKLVQLKEQGILTDSEFQGQKLKLLS